MRVPCDDQLVVEFDEKIDEEIALPRVWLSCPQYGSRRSQPTFAGPRG